MKIVETKKNNESTEIELDVYNMVYNKLNKNTSYENKIDKNLIDNKIEDDDIDLTPENENILSNFDIENKNSNLLINENIIETNNIIENDNYNSDDDYNDEELEKSDNRLIEVEDNKKK